VPGEVCQIAGAILCLCERLRTLNNVREILGACISLVFGRAPKARISPKSASDSYTQIGLNATGCAATLHVAPNLTVLPELPVTQCSPNAGRSQPQQHSRLNQHYSSKCLLLQVNTLVPHCPNMQEFPVDISPNTDHLLVVVQVLEEDDDEALRP
jgi:hypothetical protein